MLRLFIELSRLCVQDIGIEPLPELCGIPPLEPHHEAEKDVFVVFAYEDYVKMNSDC